MALKIFDTKMCLQKYFQQFKQNNYHYNKSTPIDKIYKNATSQIFTKMSAIKFPK